MIEVAFPSATEYKATKRAIMKNIKQNLRILLHGRLSRRTSKKSKSRKSTINNEAPDSYKESICNSKDEERDVLNDLCFQKASKRREPSLCYFQRPLDLDILTLQKLLGLRDQDTKQDVSFLAISLKTLQLLPDELDAGKPTAARGKIVEFAISTLDTRDLFKTISRNENMSSLIKTEYYIIDNFSTGRPQHRGREQECAFANPKHITARRVKFILTKAFKIRDGFATIADGETRYRDVVFVGCSPQFDRQTLVDNGYELWNGGRTKYSIDLLPLTRWMYGYSEYLNNIPLRERFSLDSVLSELLVCKGNPVNTGDMAAYMILAMLQLAIKSYEKLCSVQAGKKLVNSALKELVMNELSLQKV